MFIERTVRSYTNIQKQNYTSKQTIDMAVELRTRNSYDSFETGRLRWAKDSVVRVKYIRWVNGGYQILLADERYINCTYEFLHELLNSRNNNEELTNDFKCIMMAEFTELCWPEFKDQHKEGNGVTTKDFLMNLANKSVPTEVCPLPVNKKTGVVGDCYRKVCQIHQDLMDVYNSWVQDKGIQSLYNFVDDVPSATGVLYLRSRKDLPSPQSVASITESLSTKRNIRRGKAKQATEQGSSEGNMLTSSAMSPSEHKAPELIEPEQVINIECLAPPFSSSDLEMLRAHQTNLEIGGMRQASITYY